MCDACEKTEFGCCVDLENAARGPNFEGCPDDDTPAFIDCATTVSFSKPDVPFSSVYDNLGTRLLS